MVWECELFCLIIWGGSAAGGGWCWEASLLGRWPDVCLNVLVDGLGVLMVECQGHQQDMNDILHGDYKSCEY
jgi:hypothetical protein